MTGPAYFHTVDFEPLGRRTPTGPTATLLDAAQQAGVGLQAICGGAGICGSCRVRRMHGDLSPLTSVEIKALRPEELADGYRLACQASPRSDVRIDVPPDSLTASQRLQVEAQTGPIGSSGTPVPAADRLEGIGLAVDLGTTKVAAYLVDLTSGRTLAMGGVMNPQIAYGEDIISRIAYAGNEPARRAGLRQSLQEALGLLVNDLCAQIHVRNDGIVAAVVVGNTVMHHLFVGLPVHQLGVAPYLPASCQPLTFEAPHPGLAFAPRATLYLPPNIAGYVGGDHVAMLLASGADRASGTRLLIDIGTNSEVSLWHDGELLTCSCPSGPAFEGAHISAGMRAAPGAIERVRIVDGQVFVTTIGNGPASGICGSGILDAVAEMAGAGVLNRRGSLIKDAPRVRIRDGRPEFVLVAGAGATAGGEREIVITRRDVNEIQLAKAAVRSGIETLLTVAGIEARQLDEVILAGAFGTYLDVRSAIRIGMFPPLPPERFHQIGNAAGLGARQMLVSAERRRSAESLALRARYVELSSDAGFTRRFLEAVTIDNGAAAINPRSGTS
jgi:uncharacterized 2Fe-2S/4Fe-4S cluster protein (DUF4445 family)